VWEGRGAVGPASSQHRQVEVLDAFLALLSDGDGEEASFYDRLAQAVCETSDLDRAMVVRYDPAQRRVRLVGSFGLDVAPFSRVPLSIESTDIAKEALLNDRVVEALPPFDARVPDPFEGIANEGALVCVPMCTEGRRIGVVIGQRRGATVALTQVQRDALWTLGKTAALATAARIATFQQSRARALQDRVLVAREVHDRVVQRLFGVSLALSASRKDLAGEERERCAREIGEALAELRDVMSRPLEADRPAPTTTLAEELARLEDELAGVEVRIEGEPGCTPDELQEVAQGVLAEAVLNARKHAAVRRLQVGVAVRDDAYVLEVANDGVPEDGAGVPRGTGMGLKLAAFSALGHGGVVEFGRRDPGWWQVRLVVPVAG
jgi:signal transduction histidine kinase